MDLGRYELVERLAVGVASERFLVALSGEHGFRRRIVLERLLDDAQAQTFIEDAKLAATLSHARIVQTLELGRIEDVPYVAVEYVDGVDLLGLLQELARTRRTMGEALAAWVAQALLDALDYAHTLGAQPVLHGRLSLSNVLLGARGEVKLRGFGVPRPLELDGREDYGHMAPEQVMEQPVDARADVFGAGVLLAEMLVGRRLFAARNAFDVLLAVRDVRLQRLDDHAPHCDGALVAIVRKALARKPQDRWPTAAAFRDALDAWLFAHRVQAMNPQLGALVASVRAEVDQRRRAGITETPELDDLPELPGLPVGPAQPRTIRIPPARVPKGSTKMVALAKPDERPAARGTAEPKLARGTEASPPLAKPARPKYHSDPIPPLSRTTGRPTPPRAVGRVRAKSPPGAIGMGLADVLPARAEAPAKHRQTTQLLTPEQLARAGQPPPPMLVDLGRAAAPDDEGDFARTSPLRILFRLMRAQATGLLAVSLDAVRKDIYVRDGALAGVWSNDKADLFGNYLVAQRVLSEGELAMALATMAHYGGKIGDTLVELGLLTHVDVFRHLSRHARMRVVAICTWSEGRYAWYAGKEHAREAFGLEAEGFSMLGEAVLAMPASTIERWVARHCEETLIVAKPQRVAPDGFGVHGVAEVLDAIDHTRRLGELVDRHPVPLHAGRVLYLLVACDLVRLA